MEIAKLTCSLKISLLLHNKIAVLVQLLGKLFTGGSMSLTQAQSQEHYSVIYINSSISTKSRESILQSIL